MHRITMIILLENIKYLLACNKNDSSLKLYSKDLNNTFILNEDFAAFIGAKEGDKVVEDDVLLEIATDKVDSEIPSPVEGMVKKILFSQDDTIAVGTVIAVIDMDADGDDQDAGSSSNTAEESAQTVTAGSLALHCYSIGARLAYCQWLFSLSAVSIKRSTWRRRSVCVTNFRRK